MKNNETDAELWARMQKASKEAKKWVARHAHVKEPSGMSMMVGRHQTEADYKARLAALQMPKSKSKKQKKKK